MNTQYITRKGSFDAGHRIMNENRQCFNLHGHTYLFEIIFSFTKTEEIGYAIDFKEIKRVGVQWIEDYLDHAIILNPVDLHVISVAKTLNSKFWLMSLHGEKEYCNPSVENIAKEIFLALNVLFNEWESLKIHSVRLHETPNCFTDCFENSISAIERNNFMSARRTQLDSYRNSKGKLEYDDRKISECLT